MSKKEEVLALIADLCDRRPDSLEPGHDLVVDLNIDSPKALELLVELEELLGVEISDQEAARLESVGDVLAYVETIPG